MQQMLTQAIANDQKQTATFYKAALSASSLPPCYLRDSFRLLHLRTVVTRELHSI